MLNSSIFFHISQKAIILDNSLFMSYFYENFYKGL